MLRWALIFLVVALIAAFLGFGGLAGTAVGIAKILFFVFLVLFLVFLPVPAGADYNSFQAYVGLYTMLAVLGTMLILILQECCVIGLALRLDGVVEQPLVLLLIGNRFVPGQPVIGDRHHWIQTEQMQQQGLLRGGEFKFKLVAVVAEQFHLRSRSRVACSV